MTVQPSDRIAAGSICAIAELRVQILAGEHDDHDYVQAMMRNREAETERCLSVTRECDLKGVLAPGIADGMSMAAAQIEQAIRGDL